MVSMKTPDEGPEIAGNNPYGYGLEIRLNDDQCEALGITAPIKAGTQVGLQAIAIVKSATESVEDDGDDAGTDVYLTLQITDLDLTPQGQVSNAATLLYGD